VEVGGAAVALDVDPRHPLLSSVWLPDLSTILASADTKHKL
jgi:hypothetical protein